MTDRTPRGSRSGERHLVVSVVAYRSAALLESCLEPVFMLPHLDEVLVVDHGDDGSAALASALGARTLLDASNPGFGAGHNHAARSSTAPLLLLLNPDAVIDPEAVTEGIEIMLADDRIAAVQGEIAAPDGTLDRSQGRALAPVHLVGRALGLRRLLAWSPVGGLARRLPAVRDAVDRSPEQVRDVESLAATALLVRRNAFDEVGGFDERYFLYGEDQDLCHRWRQHGWRLVAVPRTWARHSHGSSFASSWQRELHWWRGTMTFAATWWSTPSWVVAIGASTVQLGRLLLESPRGAASAARALLQDPIAVRHNRRR